MKQIIPFYKEIVFKTNIASITSMSLEHQEKVLEGEVSGDFIIFGDYKIHNDTTEKEKFKYKLPFTALIPDNVDTESITVDVENFNYEQIDSDVIRIDINFSIQGEIIKEEIVELDTLERLDNEESILDIDDSEYDCEILDEELDKIDKEIDEILKDKDMQEVMDDSCDEENFVDEEENLRNENDDIMEEMMEQSKLVNENNNLVLVTEKNQEQKEEYVTYHVHIVKEIDTLENILKNYNVTIDCLKEYNEISEIKVGDKIIIPEYGEE